MERTVCFIIIGLFIFFTGSCKQEEKENEKPRVTSTKITSITPSSAICASTIISDGGLPITTKGVVWGISADPTLENHIGITDNGSGTDSWESELSGLTPNTIYYVRAYATNSIGTGYGIMQLSFKTPMPDGPGSTVADIDGNVYNTVWIGGKLWMKENLKTTKLNDGKDLLFITDDESWENPRITPGYCWYYNNEAMYNKYGALYDGYAMQTDKLCPLGWHIPTIEEWTELIDYAGGSSVAGAYLKSTIGWDYNGNGTDIYGFSALPGGYRINDGYFGREGMSGVWWSRRGYGVNLEHNESNVSYAGSGGWGLSVRCVKN